MKFPSVVRNGACEAAQQQGDLDHLRGLHLHGGDAGFFMWMMMNPGMARTLGLLGQKAKFAFGGQSLDWPSFLTLIVEMGGVGGLIICSIIVAYVFGREYVEGTAKNLLALPIPRSRFVLAKIVVSAAWFAALTLWMIAGGVDRRVAPGHHRDSRAPLSLQRRQSCSCWPSCRCAAPCLWRGSPWKRGATSRRWAFRFSRCCSRRFSAIPAGVPGCPGRSSASIPGPRGPTRYCHGAASSSLPRHSLSACSSPSVTRFGRITVNKQAVRVDRRRFVI